MKTDNYLKIVLTVIALAIIILILQNAQLIGKVQANDSTQKSYITVPVNPDGSINVRIKSMTETMDVNIRQIGGSSVYDALPILPKGGVFDINIKEFGGSTIYEALPVVTKGHSLDINIDQLGGFKVYGKLPVEN